MANYTNLTIVNSASYNRPIDATPDLLVTETIGQIGPEENIVELCFEFCKRYPSIKKIIPSSLKLFAQPVYSEQIEIITDNLMAAYLNASHGSYDFNNVRKLLLSAYCCEPQFIVFDDIQVVGEPSLLVNYLLGVNKNSGFQTSLVLPDNCNANAIHLYFQANLYSDIFLSNHCFAPLTHWQHCYVKRPAKANQVTSTYSNITKKFHIEWRYSNGPTNIATV